MVACRKKTFYTLHVFSERISRRSRKADGGVETVYKEFELKCQHVASTVFLCGDVYKRNKISLCPIRKKGFAPSFHTWLAEEQIDLVFLSF